VVSQTDAILVEARLSSEYSSAEAMARVPSNNVQYQGTVAIIQRHCSYSSVSG
jgi:hypothetical protein